MCIDSTVHCKFIFLNICVCYVCRECMFDLHKGDTILGVTERNLRRLIKHQGNNAFNKKKIVQNALCAQIKLDHCDLRILLFNVHFRCPCLF